LHYRAKVASVRASLHLGAEEAARLAAQS